MASALIMQVKKFPSSKQEKHKLSHFYLSIFQEKHKLLNSNPNSSLPLFICQLEAPVHAAYVHVN